MEYKTNISPGTNTAKLILILHPWWCLTSHSHIDSPPAGKQIVIICISLKANRIKFDTNINIIWPWQSIV